MTNTIAEWGKDHGQSDELANFITFDVDQWLEFAEAKDQELQDLRDKVKEVLVIASAVTGFLLCESIGDMHEYVEKLLDRPVFTHEFAYNADEIQEAAKPELKKILPELFRML